MSADQGRAADESACTPGSVPGRLAASRWAAIHLGLPLPAGSSGLPAGLGRAALERLRRTAADRRPSWPCSGWGLPSHTGHPVCGGLLHHRFTLTSIAVRRRDAGGLFSVALSRGSPRVAVNDHPALWSPDVPRRRGLPRRRDRPADSSVVPPSLGGLAARVCADARFHVAEGGGSARGQPQKTRKPTRRPPSSF